MPPVTKPVFWRDPRMPYAELRSVEDGRMVCYEPHTHIQWSMGAITGGQSTFVCDDRRYQVSTGTLVFMNPECVHACNPIDNQPWAYLMLYLDAGWLAQLRYDLGLTGETIWHDIPCDLLTTPQYFNGFCELAACLLNPNAELIDKQSRLIRFLSGLLPAISGASDRRPPADGNTPEKLQQLATYLDAHCTEDLSLDDLCQRTGYSAGYLIRAFKQYFGLTPHAYLINRRVQVGQRELKRGTPIAEAALNAGFADQPHFQRVFKRLVAATPHQYRSPLTGQASEIK